MVIRDKETNEIIGRVITNQSLTFDRAMELAGYDYIETPNEGGWSKDGNVYYDDSTAYMDYETD